MDEDNLRSRISEVFKHFGTSAGKMSGTDTALQNRLSRQLRGASVTYDTIATILERFPGVSSDWLLTGKGEMLIEDDLPKIRGSEGEDEMALHAEVAKLRGENEELHRALIKADGKVEYLENQVDKLNAMVYARYQSAVTTLDGRMADPPDSRQGGVGQKCG
jgi:hypothetical protein